jgi:hypothetical protein
MTGPKGNGNASPANFHDDTEEAIVEVSAEAAETALRELGFMIEQSGGADIRSQGACSPLALVRQRIEDADALDEEVEGFVLSVLGDVADERGMEITDADPLTGDVFDARREFERALEDGGCDE